MDSLNTAIAAFALVVSVGAAVFAARRGAVTAKTQSALAIYHDYLRLCVEHPMMASFEAASSIPNFPSLDELEDACTEDSERYLWFVSFMLSACENIRFSDDYDNDWKRAIADQITFHEGPLRVLWVGNWEHHYSEKLDELVREALPGLPRTTQLLEAAE